MLNQERPTAQTNPFIDAGGRATTSGRSTRSSLPPGYPSAQNPTGSQNTTDSHRQTRRDHEQQEVVIAVMGTTGAGKSKFINTLIGNGTAVEGHSLQSCTQQVSVHQVMHNSQRIVLIDTPGFNDTNRKDTAILQEIAEWFSETYRAGKLLSGIIYLHRITDNRMEGTALRNLRMFRELCGREAMANVTLTTTHWDVVDPARAVERETELRDTFWRGMIGQGSGVSRFDGSRDAAWQIVEPLISRHRAALKIQEQIVDQAMTVYETGAGQVVNEELRKAQKKFQEEVDALKSEWKQALEEKDQEMADMMEEEKKRAEERLVAVQKEQEQFMRAQTEEMRRQNQMMQDEIRRLQEEASSGGFWDGFMGVFRGVVGVAAMATGTPSGMMVGAKLLGG